VAWPRSASSLAKGLRQTPAFGLATHWELLLLITARCLKSILSMSCTPLAAETLQKERHSNFTTRLAMRRRISQYRRSAKSAQIGPNSAGNLGLFHPFLLSTEQAPADYVGYQVNSWIDWDCFFT
jgi:hypothetical protein